MKKTALTDDDIEAFREAVKDVKPLKKQNTVRVSGARPSLIGSYRNDGRMSKRWLGECRSFLPENETRDFLSDHILTTVHADEKLFFVRSGLQHKVVRALRQGKTTPQASLDLHKMTVEMARLAVTNFLAESLNSGYRCVHIIHGKGKLNINAPILKNQVNSWLQQHPEVLAFCSAVAKDGGGGAVYILLRRLKGV